MDRLSERRGADEMVRHRVRLSTRFELKRGEGRDSVEVESSQLGVIRPG